MGTGQGCVLWGAGGPWGEALGAGGLSTLSRRRMSLRFTIVGAGAIGCAVGAALQGAGNSVTFVERRGSQVAALRATGLTVRCGNDTASLAVDVRLPDEVTGDLGIVLVCVGASETQSVSEWCATRLSDGEFVASLQNGLCADVVAATLGRDRAVAAFVNFSADSAGDGDVRWVPPESFAIALGELDGQVTPRVRELARALGALAPVITTSNVWGYLWGKLGYVNVLVATGITDATMADAIEDYTDLMVELACEVYDVADAEGIRLEGFDNVQPYILYPRQHRSDALVKRVMSDLVAHRRRNAMKRSGLWRALAGHRRTSVEAELGAVVAMGARHQLTLPLTRRLIGMVLEVEAGDRSLAVRNLQELDQDRRALLRQRDGAGK